MKLSELAKKPQLQKITITKPELVEKYGDELEFFIFDRQPLDVFTKLADVDQNNIGQYIDILQDLILNENGDKVTSEELVLPIDILTEAMTLIGEHMGK
jgi:hypothetical protein